jgi:VWFA-related protein
VNKNNRRAPASGPAIPGGAEALRSGTTPNFFSLARLKRTAHLLSLCGTTLLITAGVSRPSPQTSPAVAAPSQHPPAIHSTSRLVQISVVARNKKGEPITGLTEEDFTILDQGRPQTIAIFSGAAPVPPEPPHPLPSNVFTNRFDQKGLDPGTVTIILFDALNTATEDQSRVRKQILLFLQTLKPQDHVAIYALTTRLIILHEFTQDASALVTAVSRFTPKELATFDASTTAPIDLVGMTGDPDWAGFQNALNNANGQIADRFTMNRLGTTAGAIQAIADHVAAIPGRKSLIWVSGGIPIQIGYGNISAPDRNASIDPSTTHDPRSAAGAGRPQPVGGGNSENQLPMTDRESSSLQSQVAQAAQALNRVNVAIYAVDVHGSELDPGLPSDMRTFTPASNSGAFFNRHNDRDSSKLLADRTGGLAFFGNNDIREAIHRAFDDGRYAYTIGFYPDHNQWDGKFREIKIKTSADAAQLRYRKGYFAVPDRAEDEATTNNALREAAESPLEATTLGITVTGKTLDPASDRALLLQIALDPEQFLLEPSGDHQKASLDLLFVQRGATGETIAAEKQHFALDMTPQDYERFSKIGIILQRRLPLRAQSTELRVMVRDSASASLGSVNIPVKSFFPPLQQP